MKGPPKTKTVKELWDRKKKVKLTCPDDMQLRKEFLRGDPEGIIFNIQK